MPTGEMGATIPSDKDGLGDVTVGVVLAAGRAERLADRTGGRSKALLALGGQALVERAVKTLRTAGIGRVIVVLGYDADAIAELLAGTGAEIVIAEDWEAGNGASLAAAERLLAPGERFVLMCGDHLFSDGAVHGLMQTPGAAVLVDPAPDPAVWSEGTRVSISDGLATAFAKSLDEPAVDCGVFVLPSAVFDAAREAAARGDRTLSGAVSILAGTNNIKAVEIPAGSWWQDVDTPEDLAAARSLIRLSLGKPTDGIVSRRLNRPVSIRITMALAPFRLSPGLLSVATFLIGVAAAWSLSAGRGLAGGLLVQAASVLDGCDGETARLHGTASRRGASLDAILDRMVDAAVLAGLGLWALDNPSRDLRMVVLALAMLGWGVVAAGIGGSIERFEVPRHEEPRLISHFGGRDTRMLILAVGSVLAVPVPTIAAALSTYVVAALWRVTYVTVGGPRRSVPARSGPSRLAEPVTVTGVGFPEASSRAAAMTKSLKAIQVLLFPVIVIGAFAVVLPRITDLAEVWALLRSLSLETRLLLVGLAVWNLITYWPVLMASMPGLSFKQAAVVCQSSTTVAMTVPAGGAVAVGVSYAMYSSWGFGPAAIASSTLATFVVGISIKLLLPAIALIALLVEGDAVSGLATAALTGAILVGLGAVLFALLLGWDGAAQRMGRAIGAAVNTARRWLGRSPVPGIERRVAGFRHELTGLMQDRWPALTTASLVSQLSVFAVMLVAMRVSGISADEVTWAQAFAVFASVRLATSVPIIPGNVGIAELGYIGGLLLIGANSTESVTAVLLFRFLTYFLQIPIGGFTWWAWRRQRLGDPVGSNA